MSLRSTMFVFVAGALSLVACAGQPGTDESGEPVLGSVKKDSALTMVREANKVSGTVDDNGARVRFSSEVLGETTVVRLELNGIILTASYGADETILDGVNASDGSPALLTSTDRAAIGRALAAVEAELNPSVAQVKTKDEYKAVRHMTKAEERLFRVIDARWSQWPTAMVLRRDIKTVDVAHGWTSYRRYAATNTTVTGCHDCNNCDFSGDCCDSGYKIGENFNDLNYGNCGVSDTGSQFTGDCINHDQCVRTSKHGGHAMASMYCNDQFASASDDEMFAGSCDYDWRGTASKGNCPTSWKGTGDGCDCFCQFQDPDCSL